MKMGRKYNKKKRKRIMGKMKTDKEKDEKKTMKEAKPKTIKKRKKL